MTPLPDPEALRARLEALRAQRGFLLAHHGALAAGAPDLHDAYLRMYQALAVTPRHLDPLSRQSVWLAVLVIAREGIGTHHLDLFRRAGGTEAEATDLIAMAGFAGAFDGFAMAGRHWGALLPGLDPAAAYDRGLAALGADRLGPQRSTLAMLAAQAARHSAEGVAHHLRHAYALSLPEETLVEALSLVIWPLGVNCFLDACTVWHDLMQRGEVQPSARFRVWAETPGMGGHDPTAGRPVGGFAPADASPDATEQEGPDR